MHATCREWIVGILESHPTLVALAVRQRAKFEGWLKFELAQCAAKDGADSVEVEPSFDNGRGHSDIAFQFGNTCYYLELKTPNTNWRVPGVANKTRPITENINSIVRDAQKLQDCPGQGIVAFTLFPVPSADNRWKVYLKRIADELDIGLSESRHCTRVNVPLGDGRSCDVVVCCFPYPSMPENSIGRR